jgi:tetratricopeptide (TPR) repeat protein
MGNAYFLLTNYARALAHYRRSAELKQHFSSRLQETLFNYHLAYCLWQQGESAAARNMMARVLASYEAMGVDGGEGRAMGVHVLSRMIALFYRYDGDYARALEWYKKVLDHGERHSLNIDRARYCQEIAFCQMRLGDHAAAEEYLGRAARLLVRYPDDRRRYYLKIKFFGLGPTPLWNMGIDAVAIGESRLFQPLKRRDKQLLNLELQSEVAEKRGDLKAAIRYQEEKLRLMRRGSREMDRTGEVATLNNLGHLNYLRGRTAGALEYFSSARAAALKRDNLQGAFAATMNLANCYASMLESGGAVPEKTVADIAALARSLELYRADYSRRRLTEEMDLATKRARAGKTDVSEAEIEEIRNRIEIEAAEKNHSIDIALAVLTFSLAGHEGIAGSAHAAEYARAQELFMSALELARDRGNTGLEARLLLNVAACHESLGRPVEAYARYLEAREIGEKTGDRALMFLAGYRTGMFLAAWGRAVEGEDFREAACAHFDRALALVNETPMAFRTHLARVEELCETYIRLLADEGNFSRVLTMTAYANSALAALQYYRFEPDHGSREEGERYRSYVRAQDRLIRAELALATAAGAQGPMAGELAGARRDLVSARAFLEQNFSGVAGLPPYAVAPPGKAPALPEGTAVSMAVSSDGAVFVLHYFRGKLAVERKAPAGDGGPLFVFNDSAAKRYVLLNKTLHALLQHKSLDAIAASP